MSNLSWPLQSLYLSTQASYSHCTVTTYLEVKILKAESMLDHLVILKLDKAWLEITSVSSLHKWMDDWVNKQINLVTLETRKLRGSLIKRLV